MTECTLTKPAQADPPDPHYLSANSHKTREEGMCFMEMVAFLAGEEHSDKPECASPVLSSYGRAINDGLDDERRQRLLPIAKSLINTRCDECEQRRALKLVSLSLRETFGRWLHRQGMVGAARIMQGVDTDLQSILDAVRSVSDITESLDEPDEDFIATVQMGQQVCAYVVQHHYHFTAAECGDLEAACDDAGDASTAPLFLSHLEQAIAECPHDAERQMATFKDLLPDETSDFQYEFDAAGLSVRSRWDPDLRFVLRFGDHPAGQDSHAAQFLFDMWRAGFNSGRAYSANHPAVAGGASQQTAGKPNPALPAPSTTRRAVDLTRSDDSRLEGPCPWCGDLVRISVDVFYSRFVGGCPSCKGAVAYRAPAGTFRSDVVDVAAGIWLIDRTHYCAQCRYFVPDCRCSPPTVMPVGVAAHTPPPWEFLPGRTG